MALTEEGIVAVPGMLSRWVRLPSGAKAHYMTSGETGPAVVLLHGGIIGSSGTAGFRFMAPFLGANGFRVYCPDMPGFGLTEDGDGDAYSPDEAGHLDFLHEFVTALCIDRFHVSGNSMGCSNAVNYITAHPEHIISYALIAGGIGDILPMRELRAKDQRPPSERPNIQQFDGTAESMKRMLAGIILDPTNISDEMVDMRTAAANRHQAAYEKRIATMMNREAEPNPNVAARMSTKGRFDRLTIPGIYMYGTKDVLIPHDLAGYPQEDALSSVQFFYPDDTGHQGQTDRPDLFNQVFLEFFRDGKVSWDTAQQAGISTRRPPNPDLVAVPAKVEA
jgi:2-hydroxy-6-oxonona-2,4-dienedioate hydrolase